MEIVELIPIALVTLVVVGLIGHKASAPPAYGFPPGIRPVNLPPASAGSNTAHPGSSESSSTFDDISKGIDVAKQAGGVLEDVYNRFFKDSGSGDHSVTDSPLTSGSTYAGPSPGIGTSSGDSWTDAFGDGSDTEGFA